MTTWYYEFADGYFCWITGKMDKGEKAWEIRKHGKILVEKKVA